MLNYLDKRQNSTEFLSLQVQQNKFRIQQLEKQLFVITKKLAEKTEQVGHLTHEFQDLKTRSNKEIINLNLALKKLQSSRQTVEGEKGQLQYQMQILKNKQAEDEQQHKKVIAMMKEQYDLLKAGYLQRIANLETKLDNVNKFYNVGQSLKNDREQIIKDFQKQTTQKKEMGNNFNTNNTVRVTILQNQQLTNELQYQSQQIVNLLTRNQKLTEQVAYFKRQMEIHKQVENDLVKRSSLSQNVVKQLNGKIKELQIDNKSLKEQIESLTANDTSSPKALELSTLKKQLQQYKSQKKQLNIQISTLRNQINYLENKSRLHQTKYQSLAVILSHYLQNLLVKQQKQGGIYNDMVNKEGSIVIDVNQLRQKQIKQWKQQQTETVVHFLLAQLRPLITKKSLISFPETRNVNISLVQQPNKQPINLPKIVNQHEQAIQSEKKKQNRFKDVPLDISTKIVRSNLRNWGNKIDMGNKKKKSNSFYEPKAYVGN